MSEPRLDLDDFLCFAIHSTAHAIQRANKPQLEALGLTYPQYLVMVVLWAQDDQTVGSIGERLFLESSTLTPLLKRLESAGLVRRMRDTADERQVRVHLTEAGHALREKVQHTPGWLEQVYGGDTAEADALRQNVIRLRDRLLQCQRESNA